MRRSVSRAVNASRRRVAAMPANVRLKMSVGVPVVVPTKKAGCAGQKMLALRLACLLIVVVCLGKLRSTGFQPEQLTT
ncbi:hypothetical protein K8Q93_01330 [Candidatus Parcubacteria bacterium]|nr:hypothetical protein [Candidatus Parcubacteria bacterium]